MADWAMAARAASESRNGGIQPPQIQAEEKSETGGEQGAPRILVVEDDFLVSLEIQAALTGAGFNVVGVATTAEEAERHAAEQRPDLLVMDVRLLGPRDGVEAALTIFRTLGIRTVFATAHDDRPTRERASPAHPFAWLPKPYAMETLVATVRTALDEMKN